MSVSHGARAKLATLQMMTFRAADIAAALRERLPHLPLKKLHKLLYYCQGHHLAAMGAPLFSEDPWLRANATRRPKGSVRIESAWLIDSFGSEADDDGDELTLDSSAVTRWLAGAAERRRDELHQDSYEALRARRSVDAS